MPKVQVSFSFLIAQSFADDPRKIKLKLRYQVLLRLKSPCRAMLCGRLRDTPNVKI